MKATNIHIRKATASDIPRLKEVIEASVRGLQTKDYSPTQIEGALQSVYGVDSQLIADGTYLVAGVSKSMIGCSTACVGICEKAAQQAGFTRLEMGATLSGVAFYKAKGYAALENLSAPLGSGETLPIVRMVKKMK